MIEILTFMAPAICMCIILVGICGYVGLHVVMREVIFIDIALAQIAALGASVGIFIGLELNDPWIYVIALSLTLIASILLSGTQKGMAMTGKKKITVQAMMMVNYDKV